MKKTNGISIIACGVFGKYGLELEGEGVDALIYESQTGGMGIAACIDYAPTKDEDEKNAKAFYLYDKRLEKRLGFNFCGCGDVEPARIYVHHPEEEMIIREIEEQSKKYNDIKLPKKVIRQINKSWQSGKAIEVYQPLENWAKEFVRNFSEYLPECLPAAKQKI